MFYTPSWPDGAMGGCAARSSRARRVKVEELERQNLADYWCSQRIERAVRQILPRWGTGLVKRPLGGP